nr:hypothetical protein SHINE37_41881 [Rhizobiaceae bacterium]
MLSGEGRPALPAVYVPVTVFKGLAIAALTPPERRAVRREIGRARRPARGGLRNCRGNRAERRRESS